MMYERRGKYERDYDIVAKRRVIENVRFVTIIKE